MIKDKNLATRIKLAVKDFSAVKIVPNILFFTLKNNIYNIMIIDRRDFLFSFFFVVCICICICSEQWKKKLSHSILYFPTSFEHQPVFKGGIFKNVYVYVYGWIAWGWSPFSQLYRHYVSWCPVSTLDWLSNFPHKAWVDPGEGSFTCQLNCREWESNRDLLCSNRSPWPLYHGVYTELKNITWHARIFDKTMELYDVAKW